VDEAIFHRVIPGANMLPSGQVLTVEELLPFVGIAFAGIFVRCVRERCKSGKQKNAYNKSF
jgi:thiamine transporter ThiT